MPEQEPPDVHCAICRRRLLPGERPIEFVATTGEAVVVCELCKARAEASGWLRPDEYERMRIAAPARDRRRGRGSGAFGGLLSRLASAPADAGGSQPAAREGSSPRRLEPEGGPVALPPREPEPVAPEPPVVGPAAGIPDALYAFNHSDHRRTVAGLTRTLGPPRATAIEIENGGGQAAVRLTIAWELTWYQWEVGSGEGIPEVRESSRGDTIDQLREADRTWNLMVDADGTLEQKASSAADAE